MKVADGTVEEQPADARQRRIADMPVLPRHRAVTDAAEEAVAHYEVSALAQLVDERIELRKVVAAVRVGHDDVAPARFERPFVQRGTVTSFDDRHDTRALLERNAHGLIGRA